MQPLLPAQPTQQSVELPQPPLPKPIPAAFNQQYLPSDNASSLELPRATSEPASEIDSQISNTSRAITDAFDKCKVSSPARYYSIETHSPNLALQDSLAVALNTTHDTNNLPNSAPSPSDQETIHYLDSNNHSPCSLISFNEDDSIISIHNNDVLTSTFIPHDTTEQIMTENFSTVKKNGKRSLDQVSHIDHETPAQDRGPKSQRLMQTTLAFKPKNSPIRHQNSRTPKPVNLFPNRASTPPLHLFAGIIEKSPELASNPLLQSIASTSLEDALERSPARRSLRTTKKSSQNSGGAPADVAPNPTNDVESISLNGTLGLNDSEDSQSTFICPLIAEGERLQPNLGQLKKFVDSQLVKSKARVMAGHAKIGNNYFLPQSAFTEVASLMGGSVTLNEYIDSGNHTAVPNSSDEIADLNNFAKNQMESLTRDFHKIGIEPREGREIWLTLIGNHCQKIITRLNTIIRDYHSMTLAQKKELYILEPSDFAAIKNIRERMIELLDIFKNGLKLVEHFSNGGQWLGRLIPLPHSKKVFKLMTTKLVHEQHRAQQSPIKTLLNLNTFHLDRMGIAYCNKNYSRIVLGVYANGGLQIRRQITFMIAKKGSPSTHLTADQ
ncbi:unnamed protein product [Oikopleura dioica]|uniref:Uncharacterized protein n=1 Tax=Oikopleura dioica TaxID=34765 RepID=E4WZR0_OIKDI|nr:unnamed protein product [Oikopleura dioica]